MNGINRISQKVRCVVDFEVESPDGTRYRGARPLLDQVYTVTGFLPSGMGIVPGMSFDGDLDPGITLSEVPSIRARKIGSSEWEMLGWPIAAFRPVDERETDISDLIGLGNRTTVRELEPA